MAEAVVAATTSKVGSFFSTLWAAVQPAVGNLAAAAIQQQANHIQSQAQQVAATSTVTSKSNVPTYLIAGGVAVAALAVGLKLFGGRGRGGRR
jgi:hypothetical protein